MLELLDQLKADIINGRLDRGCPLRQQELSKRYGVSRIPIRDAISVLRNQGWLVAHGKAGVMVPELNWKEAEDLYQMRSLLECQLLGYSFPNITYESLGKARDINLRLNACDLSMLERGRLNWELHATLYEVANRPTLFNMVAILNEQVRRYMGFQYGPLQYRNTSQNEHEELLDLLAQGQSDQAIKLLRQHIEVAGQQLVEYLKATS
ncbi:GntR family transcriptional regulator [Marinomonas atlantica]|uniref:GntR family transcriptional regulator n=1 Tax=Marinomonas atlantica TaxID=1806668 RepID=UPI000836E911|nr:GntR family transcriptional regulator [Marinomonas atlantica]MCO4787327.1 GntR family transcriptional regulator [Marinomonas atlantica]